MAQQDTDELYNENPKDTTLTGSDLPKGDGLIADDDIEAISDDQGAADKPTGQDHSTENREDQAPTSGVGAVQSQTDTASDIAHIED